jgi:predicted PurR-regulated permease PerM
VVFFNLIPYFGTLTVSIGGTLYLLLLGAPFEVALLVVVAVGVAHLLDNTLIAPLVLGSAVRIHPLVVILLLVIGGKYLGVLGLVVSVPLGAIVYILLQESWSILERYRLGSG